MPTSLEDRTVDFRVGTVNDLLEAAQSGAPTGGPGGSDRYRSMALAGGITSGVLALLLILVLVTGVGGGSGSDGGGESADGPSTSFSLFDTQVSGSVAPGALVTVQLDDVFLVSNAKVLSVDHVKAQGVVPAQTRIEIAASPDEAARLKPEVLNKARLLVGRVSDEDIAKHSPTTTVTTAPPAETAPASITPEDPAATSPSPAPAG